MPRIPDSFQPSVGLQAAQTPQVRAPGVQPVDDATGRQLEALGQGVKQFGFGVAAMEDRYDESMAKQNDALVTDCVTERLYDPKKGFLAQVGQNASKEQMEKSIADLEADIKHIGGSMTASQRAMWEPAANRQLQRARIAAFGHHEKERRVHAVGASTTRATAAEQQALRAHKLGDMTEVALQVGVIGKEGDAVAEVNGWDKAQRDQWVLDRTTKTHGAIVLSMVDQDPKGAKAWLAANEKQIDPETVIKLHGIVKNGETKEKALDFSFQAIGTTTEVKGKDNLVEQRAYALEILDYSRKGGKLTAEEYHAARANIRNHYSEQASIQAERDVESQIVAEKELSQNPGKGLDAFPAIKAWAETRGKTKEMASFADHQRYSTDPELVAALNNTPLEALASMPGPVFDDMVRGKLTPGETQRWKDRIAVHKGTATKKQRTDVKIDDRVDLMFRDLGVLHSKMSDAEQQDYERRKIEFYDGLKELTDEEVEAQIKVSTKDFVEEQGWANSQTEFMNLTEEKIRKEGARLFVPVPGFRSVSLAEMQEHQAEIVKDLRFSKIPVTASNIAKEYTLRIQAGRYKDPGARTPAPQDKNAPWTLWHPGLGGPHPEFDLPR